MATENPADGKGFIARLGQSFLALIGATSQSEFAEKFEASYKTIFTRLDALESAEAPAAFDPSALEKRIAAIEANKPLAKVEIETIAATKVAEAVGAIGIQPAAVAAANPAAAPAPKATAQDLIAQGKYAEAWAADAKLQEQFIKAEHYVKYMEAATAGRVFARSTV